MTPRWHQVPDASHRGPVQPPSAPPAPGPASPCAAAIVSSMDTRRPASAQAAVQDRLTRSRNTALSSATPFDGSVMIRCVSACRKSTICASRVDHGLVQRDLLALQFRRQRSLFCLKLAQPPDIRAVRRTDQMRHHVHIAKGFANDGMVGSRMRQRRPIGARYLPAAHRFGPQRAKPGFLRRLGKLAHRQLCR